MNNGISFEEACRQTPSGLTAQQLQNCPVDVSSSFPYLYVGIASFVIVAAIVFYSIVRGKKAKSTSGRSSR